MKLSWPGHDSSHKGSAPDHVWQSSISGQGGASSGSDPFPLTPTPLKLPETSLNWSHDTVPPLQIPFLRHCTVVGSWYAEVHQSVWALTVLMCIMGIFCVCVFPVHVSPLYVCNVHIWQPVTAYVTAAIVNRCAVVSIGVPRVVLRCAMGIHFLGIFEPLCAAWRALWVFKKKPDHASWPFQCFVGAPWDEKCWYNCHTGFTGRLCGLHAAQGEFAECCALVHIVQLCNGGGVVWIHAFNITRWIGILHVDDCVVTSTYEGWYADESVRTDERVNL